MWYGDPEIAPAEFPAPQSVDFAMCPPHASTAVGLSAVSVTAT